MTETLDTIRQRHAALEKEPLPENLGALLDAAAEQFGDRTCWVQLDANDEAGDSLSFAEIRDAVARCATVLAARGVGQGARVALMLPSCPAFVITWLACARLGAAIVPVNPGYTTEELGHLAALSEPGFAVVDRQYSDIFTAGTGLPETACLRHDMDAGNSDWHKAVTDAMPMRDWPEVGAETLVNLQFTSGSTGRPKACMLPQSYWLVLAAARAVQGPALTRILLDMPFHYMGGQWRFLLALRMGATVFVAPRQSLARMIDRLVKHEIGFCSVTPAFAKQPLDPRRERLSLRWAGTMAMAPDLVPEVSLRLGGAPVREMYGTTETGAIAAMPVEIEGRTGCGIAAPFRSLSIRDAEGRALPAGAAGELWVKGPGIMLGYYRNPAASAEVLRDGWFRTGDLCRMDEDGFLTIVGRIKDTIRRSGENIAASEVEQVLSGLGFLEEVAAIAEPDPMRGEEVMVCVTLAPGQRPEDWPVERIAGRIAEEAAARLARFKHPRYVTLISAMPRTASGKMAKAELRKDLAAWRVASFDTAVRAERP
ncbi:class I adenylate-forming enzyme family protein [Salipiger abyssi]|uniref:class I adenylate-forming enzyme family protein n=1 Tax=Salipiger abyssi TaxID=1250539 RepID=UPI001A8D58B3|nr:class I adenylate-forming enzyme family protein [Salipiger abyssi]MBN9885862.1 acyl--CoA ligase [Salipiger abyssi]